jgi:hypothetical protein
MSSKELKFCFYRKWSHIWTRVLCYIHRNWALEQSQCNFFPTNYFNSLLHLSEVPNTFRNFITVISLSSTPLWDRLEKPNSFQICFFSYYHAFIFNLFHPLNVCIPKNLFSNSFLPEIYLCYSMVPYFIYCFPICNSNSLPYLAV